MTFAGKICAWDINADPSCPRTTDPAKAPNSRLGLVVPMASSGSAAVYTDHHVSLCKHGLHISTWYLVAIQTTDVYLSFGGNLDQRH